MSRHLEESCPRRLAFVVLFWLLRRLVWPATKLVFCLLGACLALLLASAGEEARHRYDPVPA